jgi:hypothetical protein
VPVTVFERNEAGTTNSWKIIEHNIVIGDFLKKGFGVSTVLEGYIFRFSSVCYVTLREYLPVIGLIQAVQRLANSSPKQSAQYGLSSRLVKR